MSKNPITIPFDYTVEECAEILLKNKISGAPVVDYDGNIVGTITQTDLFKVLVSVTGLSTKGILFAFNVEDRPGIVKEIDDIIRRYGGRMASILSSYQPDQPGYRKVYIRMYDIDRSRISELKKRLQKKASLLYMIDVQENKREIYVDEKPIQNG